MIVRLRRYNEDAAVNMTPSPHVPGFSIQSRYSSRVTTFVRPVRDLSSKPVRIIIKLFISEHIQTVTVLHT
jgi:hypothetical protein